MISKSTIKILEIHSFASSACRIYPCKGATWAVTIFLIQDDNLTAEVPLRRSILQSTLRQKYRSTGRHNPQRDGGPEKGLYRLHPIALAGDGVFSGRREWPRPRAGTCPARERNCTVPCPPSHRFGRASVGTAG